MKKNFIFSFILLAFMLMIAQVSNGQEPHQRPERDMPPHLKEKQDATALQLKEKQALLGENFRYRHGDEIPVDALKSLRSERKEIPAGESGQITIPRSVAATANPNFEKQMPAKKSRIDIPNLDNQNLEKSKAGDGCDLKLVVTYFDSDNAGVYWYFDDWNGYVSWNDGFINGEGEYILTTNAPADFYPYIEIYEDYGGYVYMEFKVIYGCDVIWDDYLYSDYGYYNYTYNYGWYDLQCADECCPVTITITNFTGSGYAYAECDEIDGNYGYGYVYFYGNGTYEVIGNAFTNFAMYVAGASSATCSFNYVVEYNGNVIMSGYFSGNYYNTDYDEFYGMYCGDPPCVEVIISDSNHGDGWSWTLTDNNTGMVVVSAGYYSPAGTYNDDKTYYAPSGDYTFYAWQSGSYSDNYATVVIKVGGVQIWTTDYIQYTSGKVITHTFTADCSPCEFDYALDVTNITDNSATLTLVPPAGETQWTIEYGLAGFTPGTGTTTNSTNSSIPLTGLNPSTTYTAYIYPVGDPDYDCNIVGFMTLCYQAPPTNVTSNPTSICIGNSTNLSATTSATKIKWYTQATGGTPIGSSASGANFSVTPSTTGTVTYYAEAITIIEGTGISTNYPYQGSVQPVPLGAGSYLIECWGANGGGLVGGNGGYSKGEISLSAPTTLHLAVGGVGALGTPGAGGWNGGGISGNMYAQQGGGGGATHVATATGTLNTLSGSQSAVVIVAGGGGGAGSNWGNGDDYRMAGGKGGGLTGEAGNNDGTTGSEPGVPTEGKGGTQTAGGAGGSYYGSYFATNGSFGLGGAAATGTTGGGGGGGWYGGGGSSWEGGGGGSGYIGGVSGGVTAQTTQTGFVANPVTTGHGYIRITSLKDSCASDRIAVTVTVIPLPSIGNKSTTICSGNTFSVTTGGTDIVPAGTTYTWSAPTITPGGTGAVTGITTGTDAALSDLFSILNNSTNVTQTVTYTLTPKAGGMCTGNNFTVTVTVNPVPSIGNKTDEICSGNTFSVGIGGTDMVPAGTTYSWTAPAITPGGAGAVTGTTIGTNAALTALPSALNNTTNVIQTVIYTVTPSAGTCSGNSFTVIVTLHPIMTVGNLQVNYNSNCAAVLTWTEPAGGYTYKVYRDGVLLTTYPIYTTTYTDSNFDVTQDHQWSVTVVCGSGESAPKNVTGFANSFTIQASAGIGGEISPEGTIIVYCGQSQKFTFITELGYMVSKVYVDGELNPTAAETGNYTFSKITDNHTISVEFVEIPTYIIQFGPSAPQNAGGIVFPNKNPNAIYYIEVDSGSNNTFSIIPDFGFEIDQVFVDGVVNTQAALFGTYTFSKIKADHILFATFKPVLFTINATTGGNGTLNPNGAVQVQQGSSQAFQAFPATGYHLDAIYVDGVFEPNASSTGLYTFNNVIANHNIYAIFAVDTYIITATAGVNGTIDPLGNVVVEHGSNKTFNFNPVTGFKVDKVFIDGIENPYAVLENAFTFQNISGSHTIHVTFTKKTFKITSNSGPNGTVLPLGIRYVEYWEHSEIYVFDPDPGYHIREVLVDGINNPLAIQNGEYRFLNVTADHTLLVFFEKDNHTIFASTTQGGAINPTGLVIVPTGNDKTFYFEPYVGGELVQVIIDGINHPDAVEAGFYTFYEVYDDHTITAMFEKLSYYIYLPEKEGAVAVPVNGSYSPVEYGGTFMFVVELLEGYTKSSTTVRTNGIVIKPVSDIYTINNITIDQIVTIDGLELNTYQIVAKAYTGGTILPAGIFNVTHGDNKSFEMIPNQNYVVESVSVNGESVGAVENYTFYNIKSDGTIYAYFKYSSVGIVDTDGSTIIVFSYNNVVVILNESLVPVKQVNIIDMYGREVWKGIATGDKTEITLSVAAGIYNVRIITEENQQLVTKVIINR